MKASATELEDRFRWKSPFPDRDPYLGYSPNIQRSKLPENMQEALAIEPAWLKPEGIEDGKVNFVCATVPEMIAWLHVKASLLMDIKIEGTELRRKSDIRGTVRWKTGPAQKDHKGKDPWIVVLHPNCVDWATRPVYWTGPKDV